MTRAWVLGSETQRQFVASLIASTPPGWVVRLEPPETKRTNPQNDLLHAALADIARQVTWHGVKFNTTTWKRLCVASWLREKGEQPELIPALDGAGFDVIYEQTSKMTKKQLSELMEWIFAFGAKHGCEFKEPQDGIIAR